MGNGAPINWQGVPLNAAPTIPIDARTARADSQATTDVAESLTDEASNCPKSPRHFETPFSRTQTDNTIDDYFVRPSSPSPHLTISSTQNGTDC